MTSSQAAKSVYQINDVEDEWATIVKFDSELYKKEQELESLRVREQKKKYCKELQKLIFNIGKFNRKFWWKTLKMMKKINIPSSWSCKWWILMTVRIRKKLKKMKRSIMKSDLVTVKWKTRHAEKERSVAVKRNSTPSWSNASRKKSKRPKPSNFKEKSKASSTSSVLKKKTKPTSRSPSRENVKKSRGIPFILETLKLNKTTADFWTNKKNLDKMNLPGIFWIKLIVDVNKRLLNLSTSKTTPSWKSKKRWYKRNKTK